jgi:hypothetical protein
VEEWPDQQQLLHRELAHLRVVPVLFLAVVPEGIVMHQVEEVHGVVAEGAEAAQETQEEVRPYLEDRVEEVAPRQLQLVRRVLSQVEAAAADLATALREEQEPREL